MADKKAKVPRAKMPEQDPDVRRRNFEEVPLGLTPEMAVQEAARCLQCKTRMYGRVPGIRRYSRLY